MKKCFPKLILTFTLVFSLTGHADQVCPMSKEQEHKVLYEQYKMPELQSIFDDCGFGDLLDFSNVSDAIFNKLKEKASSAVKGIGFCGFTTRDVWDMYDSDYKFPGDVAGDVIKELEGELDKSVENIEFPITKNTKTLKSSGTNKTKNNSKLYDLIFGDKD